MNNIFKFQSQIGIISVEDNSFAITAVRILKNSSTDAADSPSPLAEKAMNQLIEYFEGTRKSFDLLLSPSGTDFQKLVWNELQKIPYGEVCTYRDIALRIGKPNASGAVGGANNKNPVWIIIPCHRVIGTNGKLVGYSGGLDIKKYLLELERKNKISYN